MPSVVTYVTVWPSRASNSAMTLAMLLKISGHEVATAHDGEAAVEVAGQMRPDVVLLDIGLPKISGYEAAKRIRSQPWGAGRPQSFSPANSASFAS